MSNLTARIRESVMSLTKAEEELNQPINYAVSMSPVTEFSNMPLHRVTGRQGISGLEDRIYLSVLTARLRRTITGDQRIERRRNLQWEMGNRSLRKENTMDYYNLPPKAEPTVRLTLQLLDELLVGVPASNDRSIEPSYFLDEENFKQFMCLMEDHINKGKRQLKATNRPIPPMPLWGHNNDPLEAWRTNDFEILCVYFRDQVENCLGYLYFHHALHRASKQKSPKISTSPERSFKSPRTSTRSSSSSSIVLPIDSNPVRLQSKSEGIIAPTPLRTEQQKKTLFCGIL